MKPREFGREASIYIAMAIVFAVITAALFAWIADTAPAWRNIQP